MYTLLGRKSPPKHKQLEKTSRLDKLEFLLAFNGALRLSK